MEEDFSTQENPMFDMGISTLARINYTLWNVNNARASDDVGKWVRWLTNLYAEIEAFLKDGLREDTKSLLKVLIDNHRRYNSYVANYTHAAKHIPGIPFVPPKEVFDKILEVEIKLRRELDASGLLMKKGDKADEAM